MAPIPHLRLSYLRRRLGGEERHALAALALSASLACGDMPAHIPAPDANDQTAHDAGADLDAGEVVDAGLEDAGFLPPMPPPEDAGDWDSGEVVAPMPPPMDAGDGPRDAGEVVPPMPPPRDSGVSPRDSGEVVPPMPPPRDSGVSPRDSGEVLPPMPPPRDAGHERPPELNRDGGIEP